jgi:hypothetical protein
VHETVTLASLVEKESKLAEERPQIAAVFENRLRIGMKLDCDPTTIYAALLDGRYRGVIYRSDLDSDHPYNTYRHAGLPPGPIANPSLASHPRGGRPRHTDASISCCGPATRARTSSPATSRRTKPPPRGIAVASAKSESVKRRLREYLARSSRPPSPKPCGTIC